MSSDLHRDSCIDPERFAAWVDGGLPGEEAALVEAHRADCARCQAMMAAFAATEPASPVKASPAVVLPFWRRGTLRWAVPLAAAAASAAIWIAAPRESETPQPLQSVTRVEPQPEAQPLAQVPSSTITQMQRGSQASPAQSVNARPKSTPERTVAAPIESAPSLLTAPPPPLRPPPPPPPSAPPAATPAPVTPLLIGGTAVVVSEFPSQSTAFQVTSDVNRGRVQEQREERGQGRGGGVPAAALPPPPPLPPVPWPRWRGFSNGRVERSVDGGATWATAIDGSSFIASGAAPSPLVCWLIGRGGVVRVSINGGATFISADVQSAPDLAAIRAVDGLRAVVTATDGRTFSTTDGGATWREGTF